MINTNDSKDSLAYAMSAFSWLCTNYDLCDVDRLTVAQIPGLIDKVEEAIVETVLAFVGSSSGSSPELEVEQLLKKALAKEKLTKEEATAAVAIVGLLSKCEVEEDNA